MYIAHLRITDKKFRAYRGSENPGQIGIGNDDGLAIWVQYAEAQQLMAELTRELKAVEAEARGSAA